MFEESTLNIVESINNQIMGITDEPSDPNKIIFLDVDGVLNAPDFFFKMQKEYDIDRKDLRIFEACSPVAMSFLRLIIRETNARIVWSSTWRNYLQGNHRERKILEGWFTAYGIPWTIERTPNEGKTGNRGGEIQEWIDRNHFKGKFVIVDDDSDMDHLMDKLVHIDGQIGLTKVNAEEIIRRLNEGGAI